jgi:phospholipid transport system substrate-binding protein
MVEARVSTFSTFQASLRRIKNPIIYLISPIVYLFRVKYIVKVNGIPNMHVQYQIKKEEFKMSRHLIGIALITALLILIPLQVMAATPKETVETGVNEVLKTLADPAFKAKSKDVKIEEIGNIIGGVFDFNELSRRTLGKQWRKLNEAQQKEFVELFRKLLQGVYADRLLAYTDQKVVFDNEKMLKKGRAEVQSHIVLSDGNKVPIFYRLTDKSGEWKVYDLIIEGVSMVKNYRTQFREILAKDSPEELLQIMRDKVSKG